MDKYPAGSIHCGLVSRLTAFGAFITLEPGIDGLLHISKLGSGRRINHPREVLESGQEITVRIDAVDKEKQRISLVPEDHPAGGEEEVKQAAAARQIVEDRSRPLGTLGDLLGARIAEKKSGKR
jgi:small subunit ribosomal protein S1